MARTHSPEPYGRLGAPDVELYYRAAQSALVHSWIHGAEDIPFLRLEKLFTAPLPLPTIIFEHIDRRTGILDSLNSPRHAWHCLLQLQAGALLYSPEMPVEWMIWLAPCRDHKSTQRIGNTKSWRPISEWYPEIVGGSSGSLHTHN